MKKVALVFAICMLLSGCSATGTFETVDDDPDQSVAAMQKEMIFDLPQDAVSQTVQGEHGQFYFCDDYEITMQTLQSGDLDKTLRELTGFGRDDLTVIQTGTEEALRYDCVWTAAGEGGDMVGRAVVLDDGSYHYCMTAMATDTDAANLRDTWKALFDSFTLG